MKTQDWKNLGWGAALLIVAALLPLTNDGYLISLGVSIAMYTVLATSWALFSGPTHYISLATAAFFGIGTYVMGSGIEHLPYWVLLPIAGLIGGGGFGTFVFQGLNQTATDLILLGALPTVALALTAAIVMDILVDLTRRLPKETP